MNFIFAKINLNINSYIIVLPKHAQENTTFFTTLPFLYFDNRQNAEYTSTIYVNITVTLIITATSGQ